MGRAAAGGGAERLLALGVILVGSAPLPHQFHVRIPRVDNVQGHDDFFVILGEDRRSLEATETAASAF